MIDLSQIDFTNPVSILFGLIALLIFAAPAVGLLVRRIRRNPGDSQKVEALIQSQATTWIKTMGDRVAALESNEKVFRDKIDSLEKKSDKDDRDRGILIRHVQALTAILQRSDNHATATAEEQQYIDNGNALIEEVT